MIILLLLLHVLVIGSISSNETFMQAVIDDIMKNGRWIDKKSIAYDYKIHSFSFNVNKEQYLWSHSKECSKSRSNIGQRYKWNSDIQLIATIPK